AGRPWVGPPWIWSAHILQRKLRKASMKPVDPLKPKTDMNTATYQYLLRYSAIKRGALGAYKNALANQTLEPGTLEELSWKKTRTVLEPAYENVPWYPHRCRAIGLHPKDIVHPDQYRQVPILTRDDMAENFERFISKDAGRNSLKISSTGGSSGKPLKFAMGKFGQREVQKWQM